MLFASRLANLRMLFPYIPESLNRVLMHFAQSARVFYTNTDEFLSDLEQALGDMTG
jgi:DNA-binding TFAR19-related protein (PDSD5 family)